MPEIRRCITCGSRRETECSHVDCPNRRPITAQPSIRAHVISDGVVIPVPCVPPVFGRDIFPVPKRSK